MAKTVIPPVPNWVGIVDETIESILDPIPPAKKELWAGLDLLFTAAASQPYPVPGFAYDGSGGGDEYALIRLAPGSFALQVRVTRSLDAGSTGAYPTLQIYAVDSDPTGRVDIEAPWSDGTEAWPPAVVTEVVDGSFATGGTYSAGDNHALILTEQDTPYTEEVKVNYGVGLGGTLILSGDLSVL